MWDPLGFKSEYVVNFLKSFKKTIAIFPEKVYDIDNMNMS